jgi:hypothetical protein
MLAVLVNVGNEVASGCFLDEIVDRLTRGQHQMAPKRCPRHGCDPPPADAVTRPLTQDFEDTFFFCSSAASALNSSWSLLGADIDAMLGGLPPIGNRLRRDVGRLQ